VCPQIASESLMTEMPPMVDSLSERIAERRINEEHGGEATIRNVIAVLRDLGWTPPAAPAAIPTPTSPDLLQGLVAGLRAQADWHRQWGRPEPARAIDNAVEHVLEQQGLVERSPVS
jgi:hypothetical protein